MRRKKTCSLDFQAFEARRCLAAVAGVTDGGSLFVRGEADGAVAVVAIGESTFKVTDGDTEIGTFEGVERNIVVKLNQGEDAVPNDDNVLIRLGEADIENVLVDLGSGNDHFAIGGQQAIDRVIFHGGRGDDSMLVDVDTDFIAAGLMGLGNDSMGLSAHANRVRFHGGHGEDVLTLGRDSSAQNVGAVMGDGENAVNLAGHVRNRMHVRGGLDSDTVRLTPDAVVGGSLTMNLGHGDNTLNLAGTVAGHLRVRAGAGTDAVNIAPEARVGHSAGMVLGNGDNTFNIAGSFGGNVYMRGEAGNDDVFIYEPSKIRGNVGVLLGEGENTFTHNGEIFQNLVVLSKNPDDAFSVNGLVHGFIRLGPGQQ